MASQEEQFAAKMLGYGDWKKHGAKKWGGYLASFGLFPVALGAQPPKGDKVASADWAATLRQIIQDILARKNGHR